MSENGEHDGSGSRHIVQVVTTSMSRARSVDGQADHGTRSAMSTRRWTLPSARSRWWRPTTALPAMLWENDRPRRVRLNIAAEDDRHPVLVEAERQLAGVLCRAADAVRAEPGSGRHGVPTQGVGRVADHPVRRDAILRTDRGADWQSRRRTRGRGRQRQESRVDRRAVPPGRRRDGQAHRIRRRARRQGSAIGARTGLNGPALSRRAALSCFNSFGGYSGGSRRMKDNRLLDGRAVRDRILDDVAERVREAAATHAIGRLVSISIGEHKEVAVYVRGQANAARRRSASASRSRPGRARSPRRSARRGSSR